MIVGSRDFRDEEYEEPRKEFEAAGYEVVTVSSIVGRVRGVLGTWVAVDRALAGCRASEFDGVVFVGGYGALEYEDNRSAHRLCCQALAGGKVLAALCVAPIILARAGVLNMRRATSFPDQREAMEACGAVHTGDAVTVDGLIVTGDGPMHTRQFARAVLKALESRTDVLNQAT
ncbi:MAG: DJ-1/PfpI family protein [Deltaproteobacteria bacterium]|nr:DJ-1/PfpI family protein [Deltaproteobacteria bacterium]